MSNAQQDSLFTEQNGETEINFPEGDEKYKILFEKSQDALLIIHNGKFTACNEAAIKMLHYARKEDFLNTHPSKLSPKQQSDGKSSVKKANEMMELAFKNGSHRFEWVHKKSNGELLPVEVLLTLSIWLVADLKR